MSSPEDPITPHSPIAHYYPDATSGSTSPGKVDVITPVRFRHLRLIIKRKVNHLFRKSILPSEIERIWLYERDSAHAITHFITIGAAKRPGEVNDPTMRGNVDFDNGLRGETFAYEIFSLCELEVPITRRELYDGDGTVVARRWTRLTEYWADYALSHGVVGVY